MYVLIFLILYLINHKRYPVNNIISFDLVENLGPFPNRRDINFYSKFIKVI